MRTLYLRNVPDEVYDRLARLAAIDHTSVGALAVRELAEASRRVDNPSLLARLPDLVIGHAAITVDLDDARDER